MTILDLHTNYMTVKLLSCYVTTTSCSSGFVISFWRFYVFLKCTKLEHGANNLPVIAVQRRFVYLFVCE